MQIKLCFSKLFLLYSLLIIKSMVYYLTLKRKGMCIYEKEL